MKSHDVPEGWAWITLSKSYVVVNDKNKQIKTLEYQTTGKIPIVDQSSDFICGYTDDESKKITISKPLIVFGDHTRHVKLISFDFAVGADGTQLLEPSAKYDARFLYYVICRASELIGNYGYDRHLKHLNKFRTKAPNSLEEQRKIASVLFAIDKAIEKTKALIGKKTKIKEGLMQTFFSINKSEGMIDIELGNPQYFELKTGGTPSTSIPGYWGGNIKWMTSGDIHRKRVYDVEGRITERGYKNSNASFIPQDSILIALAGQGKTRGTVAINKIPITMNQSVAAVIPNKAKIVPEYLYYYLDNRYIELRSISAGAGRAGLSLSIIAKYRICIPKDLEKQKYISRILSAIDNGIICEYLYLNKLHMIKDGLLQDLLTGKVRVKMAA